MTNKPTDLDALSVLRDTASPGDPHYDAYAILKEAVAQAREDALEEAATVCDLSGVASKKNAPEREEALRCARQIRALKQKTKGGGV